MKKKLLLLLLIGAMPITTFAKTSLYDMVVDQSTGKYKYEESFSNNPNMHGVTIYTEVVNDEDYEVYVYTGSDAKTKNYVRIGDMCFNILRTTYSEGVKLTYYGPYEDGECIHERISGYYNTDTNLSLKHVGYMYGDTPSSYEDISSAFLNQNDSDIKIKLDRFYQERLTDYNDWMNDDIYCNDRTIHNSYHFNNGEYAVEFEFPYRFRGEGGYNTLYTATLSCAKNDSFTVSNKDGNKALTYPIGTISYDEIELSRKELYGYAIYNNSSENWIYERNNDAWTMTAIGGNNSGAGVLTSSENGYDVYNNLAIIPVISVNKNVCVLSGNGDYDNPYELYYDDGVIRGQVVWNDEENKEGKRPEQVSIKIYADGTVVDEIIVKASDDWKFEIKVDEYSDLGNKISYVLTQDGVEGYELDVSGSYDEGYTLTNTHMITEPIPENKEEEVKAETEKEEKKPENPKTGRNNTMIISLSILVLMVASYFFIRKQDLFKSNL